MRGPAATRLHCVMGQSVRRCWYKNMARGFDRVLLKVLKSKTQHECPALRSTILLAVVMLLAGVLFRNLEPDNVLDVHIECERVGNRVGFSPLPRDVCSSIHACQDPSSQFCTLPKDRYTKACFVSSRKSCSQDEACQQCLMKWGHLLTVAGSVGPVSCPADARYDCGYPGISKTECTARACCFYETGQCGFPFQHTPIHEVRGDVLVSVVIACHRQELFVRQAMESVFNQVYQNWELVIVDDGTPGKRCYFEATHYSQERNIESHTDILSRVKLFYRENMGLAASRNFGIKMSSGQYVCALDADDLLAPSYIANAMRFTRGRNAPSVLYSDQIFFGMPSSNFIWILPTVQSLKFASLTGPLPVMSLFRRDLYDEVGGYKEEMLFGNEDYEFWLRCFRAIGNTINSEVRYVPGAGSWYRMKKDSMMRSKGYDTFGLKLVQLQHPSLYAPYKFCEALAFVVCAEPIYSIELMQRLEKVLLIRQDSCLAWILLGSMKIRHGCSKEARDLFRNALYFCRKSGFLDEKVYPFISNMFEVLETESWKPKWAARSHACSSNFEAYCSRRRENVSIVQAVADSPVDYMPYSGPLNDRLLSNRDFRDKISRIVLNASPTVGLNDVPNIFHYVYGFKEPPVPFHFYQYLAVMSAIRLNNPTEVYFHYKFEPTGLWWDRLKPRIKLIPWTQDMLNISRCFVSYAHESDVVRLRALQKWGGVYLDIDMVSFRPIERGLHAEFGIGRQNSNVQHTSRARFQYYGLGNAAMISLPRSTFVHIWLESYSHFRSCGHDENWDEHSVRLPADLFDEFPVLRERGKIRDLPSDKFYALLWGDVNAYLKVHSDCDANCFMELWPGVEVFHLWTSSLENSAFARTLESLHPTHPMLNGTLLGHIVNTTFGIREPPK
jgi:glycosyltransferase involved in cell wall biosynthesis